MNAWQKIECPVCHAWLFEAVGISTHLRIRMVCRCRRKLLIKEGFRVEVIQDVVAPVND